MDVITEGNNVTISLEQKNNTNGMKRILLYIGMVFGFLILLKIIGTCMVYNKTRIQQKHFIELSKYGSIHVLLYNHNNSDATARTILSAIRKSYSFKNIYVGVYQELSFHANEYDVYDLLVNYANNTIELDWINNNLSVVSVDNTNVGKFWAFKELIQRNIFSDIRYILMTNPGIAFDNNWDKYLLESYQTVEKESPERPILTSFLTTNNIPQQKNKVTSQDYGILQFMHSVVGDSHALLDTSKRQYYFPYVEKFKGLIPVYNTRRFPQRPNDFVEVSSVSLDCVFMKNDSLRELIELPLFSMHIASYAENTLLSTMLWMDDHSFYSIEPKMYIQKANVSVRPDEWNSKDIQKMLLQDYNEYFDFLGIDLKTRQISGRSLLGILPEQSMDDILKKYGSLAEYDRVKRFLSIT